jgi:hypothetical protein
MPSQAEVDRGAVHPADNTYRNPAVPRASVSEDNAMQHDTLNRDKRSN